MGETIGGRYRLEQRLGAGGMGEVWAAHDTQLDRRVALKLLGAHADPIRFEREAHAVAALSHPNISRLYDYGTADGRPYMVFEYLSGGTLEDRFVVGKPLDDTSSARIAGELAAGLAHAHERGLVHRDLKPTNVLFDEEGRAKIADFGIARVGGADTLTEEGTLIGTASYMSPEQASGRPATSASDVYSFGVLLYRMLSGRLPFESPSAIEVVRQHMQSAPPPLSSLRADAPATLTALAEDSLAKSPAQRPADGRELLARLGGGPAPALGEAATVVTEALRRPPSRRFPVPLGVLIALPLLALGGIALALLTTRGDSSSPSSTQTTLPTQVPSTQVTSTQQTTAPPPPP
ncbi:MAG: serine/threonine protein kinase, partial [Actinomycetota bacterium]|nr:serine/threonine protein kinase [Actinomycetota bacterium]